MRILHLNAARLSAVALLAMLSAEQVVANPIGRDLAEASDRTAGLAYEFCHASNVERLSGKAIAPLTLDNLIRSTAGDGLAPVDGAEWSVEAYRDAAGSERMSAEEVAELLNTKADGYRACYVRLGAAAYGLASKRVTIKVHPQAEVRIGSYPDITDPFMTYAPDDKITILADAADKFESVRLFVNDKPLSKSFDNRGELVLRAGDFNDGDNNLRLEASDANGCLALASETASISMPPTSHREFRTELPNVFTPDGDLVNDVFLGSDEFAACNFNLEVYGAGGNRLYKGSKGWDGTSNGTEVPPGTYFYTLNMEQGDGSTKRYKGVVTLVRKKS